jgi:hypothetical protein
MPALNILNLNSGDTQEDIRNKINSNFDSLVANGGGPQGQQGEPGPQGAVGLAGPKGDSGQQGTRGTIWNVQATAPLGGSANPVLVGDYWVNTVENNLIYQYGASGWISTGQSLQSTEIFTTLTGISGPVSTKNAIVINSPFPELNTLVLSDAVSLTPTANPTYSKVLIATNSTSDYPLLEFAKTNAVGVGTPSDYNRHPQFRWLNPSQSNYNLLFSVPQDQMAFRSGGSMTIQSTASSLNLLSNTNVTISSGSSMNVSSVGQMSFSSGSSLMTFSSQKYILTGSLMSLFVPLTISSSSLGYALTLRNTSTAGTGLILSSSTNSSSYFLANFLSTGVTRFSVRTDGKVYFNQQGSTVKTISGTYDSSASLGGNTYYFWNIGTNRIDRGNLVTMVLSAVSRRGILIPIGTAANSWSSYLSNYESIQFRIIASNPTYTIQAISYNTGGGPTVGSTVFLGTSGALSVDLTIIRGASSTDYQIYYNTCEGLCGKLA